MNQQNSNGMRQNFSICSDLFIYFIKFHVFVFVFLIREIYNSSQLAN